jgi:Rad52/22 family double-strand break repair protein
VTAFTRQQIDQMLRPINRNRVLPDGKGHAHVSQQDVTAHLIRMFGFGSFDTDIVSVECVFEHERVDKKTGAVTGRWDCCYRALIRLTIKDQDGNEICHYEDGSTATAENQKRGDAHDLAYKSALSLAKKRAAINLGDQFGLSLYNKGQLAALVRATLVLPDGESTTEDVQEGVPQQVSLGNDEVDRDLDGSTATDPASEGDDGDWLSGIEKRIAEASNLGELEVLANEIENKKAAGHCAQTDYERLYAVGNKRHSELAGAAA